MSCADLPGECDLSLGLTCQGPVGNKSCLYVNWRPI